MQTTKRFIERTSDQSLEPLGYTYLLDATGFPSDLQGHGSLVRAIAESVGLNHTNLIVCDGKLMIFEGKGFIVLQIESAQRRTRLTVHAETRYSPTSVFAMMKRHFQFSMFTEKFLKR